MKIRSLFHSIKSITAASLTWIASSGAAYPVAGNIESVTPGGYVTGWVCNTANPTAILTVKLFAVGQNGGGGQINSNPIYVNAPSESAVNSACLGGAAHRFAYAISPTEKSKLGPDTHVIKAEASYGSETSVVPGIWPSFNVTGTYRSLLYAGQLTKDCHITGEDIDKVIAGTSSFDAAMKGSAGCLKTGLDGGNIWRNAWLLSGTSETSAFLPDPQFPSPRPAWGQDSHIYFNAATYNYGWHPTPEGGGYTIGLVIDKVNFVPAGGDALYLPKYQGLFLNTPLQGVMPDLRAAENVFVRFLVKLNAHQEMPSPWEPKSRLTWGLVVKTSTGETDYLEVNLWRTTNFDLCADSDGVYDRCDVSNIRYFDGRQLSKVTGKSIAPLGPEWAYFLLPASQLFRSAFGSTGGAAVVSGSYIGMETWGKTRVWMEVKGYDIFVFDAY